MQTKICKAIEMTTRVTPKTGEPFDMVEYRPERPELVTGMPSTIHPDASYEIWYWTPEPDVPVDSE